MDTKRKMLKLHKGRAVSFLDSFSGKWLYGHVQAFQQPHPDDVTGVSPWIDVRIGDIDYSVRIDDIIIGDEHHGY